MWYDVNTLFDIHQASVNLSASMASLWLEKLDRNGALSLKAMKDCTATTQKIAASFATHRELPALLPLQAELMHEPIAQFARFWQNFIADMQSNESSAVDDLRSAARAWQASYADSIDDLSNHPWIAHMYKQWVDTTSQTWGPLNTTSRWMFDWPF